MRIARRAPLALALTGFACSATPTAPQSASGAASTSIPAPAWASEPDRETDDGHRFTCRGDGATEDDARAAARAACNDKICRLCGVEVRSVLKSEETLEGVSLSRQVEERCRRIQTRDFDVRYKTSACAPEGCTSWIQIDYSDELREIECKKFSDENYASPEECQRLINAFAAVDGMTAAAFEERRALLDNAASACAEIDVRPTPLLQTLDDTLWRGWNELVAFQTRDGFSERPARDAALMERLRQERRRNLEEQRARLARRFYPRSWPRSAQTEIPEFVARITMIRDFMADRRRVFRVVDALTEPAGFTENGATLYSKAGAEGIAQAYRALPERSPALMAAEPPHRDLFLQLAAYLEPVAAELRRREPPTELSESLVAHYARLRARQGPFEAVDWDYLSAAPASRSRAVSLAALLEHGGQNATDERYLAWVERCVAERHESLCLRAHPRADLLVRNEGRVPQAWTRSLDALLPLWERHQARARPAERRWFATRAVELLKRLPPKDDWESYCGRLERRWLTLEAMVPASAPPTRAVCSCLQMSESSGRLSRLSVLESLYTRAVERGLPCVSGGGRR